MTKVVLIVNDTARHLHSKCKPKGLKLDKARPRKGMFDADTEVFKALDEDPLLLVKSNEATAAEYSDLVNGVVVKLRKVDTMYVKTNSKSDRTKLVAVYEAYARKQSIQFSRVGKNAALAGWSDVDPNSGVFPDHPAPFLAAER